MKNIGITRDVISAEIAEGKYTLLDTGGLGYKGEDTPAALTKASEQQVEFAIAAAPRRSSSSRRQRRAVQITVTTRVGR